MTPKQVKVIIEMQPPIIKKQIQILMGKLTALNRFISRYSDRLRPFFIALKGEPQRDGDRSVTRPFVL